MKNSQEDFSVTYRKKERKKTYRNGYRCRKWTQWVRFKSRTLLFVFHFRAIVHAEGMNLFSPPEEKQQDKLGVLSLVRQPV